MKAVVELIGEYQSFQRMVTGTVAGSTTLKREFSELSLSASKSAEAQVKASVLRVSRIREEITQVQALASAYKRGSDEQIAAMTLVARKQAELNRLTGASGFVGGRGRGRGLRGEEREASGLTRGLLAGGGIEHVGLAALSGGTFFGAFLGAHAGRETIQAATEAQAVEKQLAAQYRASGKDLADYRGQIDKTFDRLSALAGFNKDELAQSYTTVFRATGSTTKALRDEAIAVNLARGRHMDLQAAALLVGKVEDGNTSILRRYGIQIGKHATALQGITALEQKFAGQARAGTTAQERFTAELHNSEVIIGTGLLPTVNHLLGEGAKWLDQMNKSGRLQKDVNTAVHDGAVVVHTLEHGVHLLVGVVKTADSITGSFKNTLEVLAALKVGSVLLGWGGNFATLAGKERLASAEAGALQTKLAGLRALGTIGITIAVGFEVAKGGQALSKWLGRTGIGSALGLGDTPLPKGVSFDDVTKAASDLNAGRLSDRDIRVLRAIHTSIPASLTRVSTKRSASAGLGPHHEAGFADSLVPTPAEPYKLTDLQRINLALTRNPNDRAAITAKIAYDKSAAAFAQRRIAEGRGSKSLVDQLSSVYSDLNSLNSQLASMSKKALAAETKATKQRLSDAKKAEALLDASQKAQQRLLDQAKQVGFGVLGALGQGPVLTGPAAQFVQQYGGHLNANAYLQDITLQNRGARAELTNLNTLRRRGAPQDLINSILGQGTAGAGMAAALAHATPAVLRAFLGQYRERQQTAIQLAKMQVAVMHVDKIVTAADTRTDARDRPSTANKFGRVPNAGRRR